ncbi:MAG: HD domain-containing protein [Gammaproteobacteria bacterium]|nr:HD domain-containing protein [Gammaproteobacteria bacterium]
MNTQYPDNVINKILQITLETHTFAYLAIDPHGVLLKRSGNITDLGLPDWKTSENILNEALFLSGMLPLDSGYELIPSWHVNDNKVVDIHLFQDSDTTWAVLVDKTEDLEWQSQARQKANELRLLQHEMEQHKKSLQAPEDSSSKLYCSFFEALDMMALHQNKDGSFELLHPFSSTFLQIFPEAFENEKAVYPQHKFLFIENFLIDAQQLWDLAINHQRITSGPWIETLAHGDNVALEAIAINWDMHKLLFIAIQDASYQQNHDFLQRGRDEVLLNNLLEKEVHKRTELIRAREEEIALRLVCAADSKDSGETGAHIRRLGLYCELMATHLGWRQDRIDEIRIAAPMHDIGKIGIPDAILKKPGKLTDDEFTIMKTHTEIGGKILSESKSSLVQMAREIALNHHEKWDGSGYPQGLVGEQIAIGARIAAIMDVFDALIHKRVYKSGMSIDEAIQIMSKGRGTHFDPDLFDLFIRLKSEVTEIAKLNNDSIC